MAGQTVAVLLSMTKTCSPLQNPPQCTAGREDVVRNYDVPGERADTRYGGRVEGTGGGRRGMRAGLLVENLTVSQPPLPPLLMRSDTILGQTFVFF